MHDHQPEPHRAAAPAAEPAPVSPKRRYASPRLSEYGDLRRIVMIKGSNKNDGGGVPATKK